MPANIDKKNVPYHLGIIPDGNRRWSKKSHLNLFRSYNMGIKKTVDCAIWAKELGIKVVTSWALSKENLNNRSSAELNTLFKLYTMAAYDKEMRKTIDRNNIRINVVGELNMLPAKVKKALKDLASYTVKNTGIIVNILICYSGKDDIMAALSKSSTKHGVNVRESYFKKKMVSRSIPDLDLIIRTSGEMRLSGFLPLQSTYAELYFTDKYWPEVQKKDLEDAVAEFSSRKRRFGK